MKMASKAYVASMTVAELTSELKKRGLSCRGKKKTLQARLEEVSCTKADFIYFLKRCGYFFYCTNFP